MIKLCYLCLILCFTTFSLKAQKDFENKSDPIKNFKIPDSIADNDLNQYKKKYYIHLQTPTNAELYIKCYLKKSFDINDSINISRGYLLLSRVSAQDSLKFKYINQSIIYAKNKNHKVYPAVSYLEKGNAFFNNGNYGETLDNYYIALEIAQKSNPALTTDIKFNIGLLKSRIDKNEEALKIFKNCHTLYESEKDTNPQGYLLSLFAISNTYTRLHQLDSAFTLNTYGIKHSLSNNNNIMYHYFVMNEGVNLFFKKKYTQSIDSLVKATPFLVNIDDHSNTILSRLYLGKSYLKSKQIERGINQFKIIDTLLKKQVNFAPETQEIYKTLIAYYKAKKDKEKQLFYHSRLSIYDSILYNNYKNINDQIIVDFDTPFILKEQEKRITNLNISYNNKIRWGLALLLLLITLSILLSYRNQILKKKYEKKFEELIHKKAEKLPKGNEKTENYIKSKELSEEIVSKIEKGLNTFVANKEYLHKNVSLNSLAKNIDSNSKYLSHYINHYQKKKFTDYINDLRITYTIEKIKEDKKFRMYTVKAISESVGFSNPISFSKAFFKKTGIKPSYFIQKIESSKK